MIDMVNEIALLNERLDKHIGNPEFDVAVDRCDLIGSLPSGGSQIVYLHRLLDFLEADCGYSIVGGKIYLSGVMSLSDVVDWLRERRG